MGRFAFLRRWCATTTETRLHGTRTAASQRPIAATTGGRQDMTKNRISQRQLRTLSIELELALARLERALGDEARETLFSGPMLSNPGDGNGLETATLTRARARHDAILDALERIAKDSYG